MGVQYGEGYTVNIPFSPGAGDIEYLRAFDEIVGPRLAEYQPDLIIVSAGFDAHRDDPLALMNVSEEGYAEMARRVKLWAQQLCGGRLVVLLEGGYNLKALASSVEATLNALDHA